MRAPLTCLRTCMRVSLTSFARRLVHSRFIFTCACDGMCCHGCFVSHAAASFLRADGMLIYRLLGDDAESSFARSWGISYGINAAAEWKDVATEAAKAAVILAILERLYLTSNASWLEVRAGGKRRALSRVRTDKLGPCPALAGPHRLHQPAGIAAQAQGAEHRGPDQQLLAAHQAAMRLKLLGMPPRMEHLRGFERPLCRLLRRAAYA